MFLWTFLTRVCDSFPICDKLVELFIVLKTITKILAKISAKMIEFTRFTCIVVTHVKNFVQFKITNSWYELNTKMRMLCSKFVSKSYDFKRKSKQYFILLFMFIDTGFYSRISETNSFLVLFHNLQKNLANYGGTLLCS
jgi:hypothetical protein